MYIRLIQVLLLGACLVVASCNRPAKQSREVQLKNKEAREDSLELAEALALQSTFANRIVARAETDPVSSGKDEDAADDPAIWVNQRDPEKSLIIGTNKKRGIQVYDLLGNTVQELQAGLINNVDLRDGFRYGNRTVTLVAGSNRENNSITFFYIDPATGRLSDSIGSIRSEVDTVYGLCLYHKIAGNRFFVFVNGKGGQIEQWEMEQGVPGIKGSLVRSFSVGSQPEGMVADDESGMLYLGIEEEGIVMVNADPEEASVTQMLIGSDSLNRNIAYDIEGLALFTYQGVKYLVASVQGNFSYAIFEVGEQNRYLTSFVIENGQVDGAEETDGIEICTATLSENFPKGLLVVQDGFNFDNDTLKSQNFKLVSLEHLFQFLE